MRIHFFTTNTQKVIVLMLLWYLYFQALILLFNVFGTISTSILLFYLIDNCQIVQNHTYHNPNFYHLPPQALNHCLGLAKWKKSHFVRIKDRLKKEQQTLGTGQTFTLIKHFFSPQTLFSNIFYSSNQLLLEILALFSNLVSFFQEVLSGLLHRGSQNMSLLGAPFLLARRSFIARVHKCRYLWAGKTSFCQFSTIPPLFIGTPNSVLSVPWRRCSGHMFWTDKVGSIKSSSTSLKRRFSFQPLLNLG